MAGTLNRVMLIGRLTRDPEMRYTPSGQPVTNFSVATDRWVGEGKPKASDFHDCVAWNIGKRVLAELIGQNCNKGSLVYIEGRLQTRSWESNDGQKRKATKVVVGDVQFLDAKSGQEPTTASNEFYPVGPGADPDDIPF